MSVSVCGCVRVHACVCLCGSPDNGAVELDALFNSEVLPHLLLGLVQNQLPQEAEGCATAAGAGCNAERRVCVGTRRNNAGAGKARPSPSTQRDGLEHAATDCNTVRWIAKQQGVRYAGATRSREGLRGWLEQ